MAEPETLTCYKHPGRETLLRCNKCNRPICAQCAVRTPTGYSCKDCIRGQQKAFNNSHASDFIAAPVVSALLAYLGSYVPAFAGLFTVFVAPLIGTGIVKLANRLTGKRRSKALFNTITAAVILGSLPLLVNRLTPLFLGLINGNFNLYGLLPLIWQAAYTLLLAGSVYYHLTGIRLG
jgi:hypothetical protein